MATKIQLEQKVKYLEKQLSEKSIYLAQVTDELFRIKQEIAVVEEEVLGYEESYAKMENDLFEAEQRLELAEKIIDKIKLDEKELKFLINDWIYLKWR